MKAMKKVFWLAISTALMGGHPAVGDTPATLDVQLYAGLNVTGAVGTVYAIQATTNAADTNSFMTVAFIQLPGTNYFWTDTSGAATGQRFYRAVTSAPTNLVFIPPRHV